MGEGLTTIKNKLVGQMRINDRAGREGAIGHVLREDVGLLGAGMDNRGDHGHMMLEWESLPRGRKWWGRKRWRLEGWEGKVGSKVE